MQWIDLDYILLSILTQSVAHFVYIGCTIDRFFKSGDTFRMEMVYKQQLLSIIKFVFVAKGLKVFIKYASNLHVHDI
jgi:hypothetical protein